MENVSGIQKLIDIKAEARLESDIRALRSMLKNNHLCGGNNNPATLPGLFIKKTYGEGEVHERLEQVHLYWLLDEGKDTFYSRLKEYWLPIYLKEEADNFMKEIQHIKEQVENLLNTESE